MRPSPAPRWPPYNALQGTPPLKPADLAALPDESLPLPARQFGLYLWFWHIVYLGVLAVLLGILFKGQSVAFMVGLAFAIACSANFPPLLLSITWRRFYTAGAVTAIWTGAALSVLLIVLSPTIWVELLGFASPVFPLRNPAIVSMPCAFLAGVIASFATREPDAEARFDDEKLRTYLGVGAE